MTTQLYEPAETSLAVVAQSEILSAVELAKIRALKEELSETFAVAQVFRTRTEMEVSVLNDLKHPTPDSKYWQAIREQNVMFGELVMLSYEYRQNRVKIKILERRLADEPDDLKRELLQVEIDKRRFVAADQERVAKDRIREIVEWSRIKVELKPHMRYSLGDVNEHQLAAFLPRFDAQAATLGPGASPAEAINLRGLQKTAKRVAAERDGQRRLDK